MPTYDVKCTICGVEKEIICKIAERNKQNCICGGNYKVQFNSSYALHSFKSGYYEHIDHEPIYCGSKRQLRGECDKRGLTSIYANEW